MIPEHRRNFVDYYELLGITKDAEYETIRTNYVRLAKVMHPDTGGSTEDMQLLNIAHQTLKGPLSRKAYDKLHTLHFSTSSELELKDDGSVGHSVADIEDEYIDMYVDALYKEYYDKPAHSVRHGRTSLRFIIRRWFNSSKK